MKTLLNKHHSRKNYLNFLISFLFSLFFSLTICKADGFELLLLDPYLSNYELSQIENSYGFQVKRGLGFTQSSLSNRGEYFDNEENFYTADGSKIRSECLLRNSVRWKLTSITGINSQGDLIGYAYNTDEGRYGLGTNVILISKGSKTEDYCPKITWTIDKNCLKIMNNLSSLNQAETKFPLTSNAPLIGDYRAGSYFEENFKGLGECKVKFQIKSPNDKAISKASYALSVFYEFGDGHDHDYDEKVILSGRTDSKGRGVIKFNIMKFYKKYFDKNHCNSMEIKLSTPFRNQKWLSNKLSYSIWDHCI